MMILPYFFAAVLVLVVADVAPEPATPESCAKKENEIFIKGGPDCQQTCENLFQKCTVNHVAPVDDCYCKPGFARNKKGECKPLWSKDCFCEINFAQMISTYFSSCFKGRL